MSPWTPPALRLIRVIWTATARSDLIASMPISHLSTVARQHALSKLCAWRARGSSALPRRFRLIQDGAPREPGRIFVGNDELRYEIRDDTIDILNIWHTPEDRQTGRAKHSLPPITKATATEAPMPYAFEDSLPNGNILQGHCAPAFEPVLHAFRDNFAARNEIGASLCITHRGETVVDLWGGLASPKTQAPWTRDTVSIVFSCTKGAAALCVHMLIERGALGLHDDVAKYWPEFATNGKEGTTVAMMLAHTSPVPHVREPVPIGGYCDFDYMVERVAAEPAWWEPGTRQGYHGVTYAWTVGNLVRLAAGQPLGEFFRTEIAGKLGLDFHIGLPESEEHRVAAMLAPDFAEMNMAAKFSQALLQPGTLSNLFMTNSGGADFNSREIHAAEICSANGITNARGLAGLYAPLANDGGTFLRPETIARISRASAATHMDATLLQPMRFGLGYMISTDNRASGGDSVILGEMAFGHVGMGGSLGFADPGAELSFGYTMNRMGAGILLNERGQSLVDATYKSLGYASDSSGAWRR